MSFPEYRNFVESVLDEGTNQESRMGGTKELLAQDFSFDADSLPRRTGLNRALGWMELCQLVAGVFDPEALERVAPKADHSLFTHQMAYGPRIADQVPLILNALDKNQANRQAVLYIGRPEDGPTDAQPCTTSIQFLVRKGYMQIEKRLQVVVSMRSWDLIRGLPYDCVMFGGLAQVVADCIGRRAGQVQVRAGSAHVYHETVKRQMYPLRGEDQFTMDLGLGSAPLFSARWQEWVGAARAEVERAGSADWCPSFVRYTKNPVFQP